MYDGLNRLRFLGHEVLVMQVLDRDELELPFDGPTIFHDIEGTDELFAEPWAFRKSYQKAMNDFLTTVARECGNRGYDHVKFQTDSPLGRSLSYFLHMREEMGRAAIRQGKPSLTMLTLLSPLLIWGTLLGVIPIIIHLLNRRRFRRVEWAAHALLAADDSAQPAANSIRATAALALADRTLSCILFFYLARPLLNPTGLETWLGSGGRTSQVVLIDDSLSMGYSAGDSTAFSRAKEAAASLVGSIRPQDRCTIVTTSAPRVPVVHEVEGVRRDELLAAVNSLPGSATHAAWPAVLEGLDEVVRSCTYPTKQLTISDRSAQGRLGPKRDLDGRPMEGGRAARADRRRGRRRSLERGAPGSCPSRSDDSFRRAQPLGGRDPQRLAARDFRRQGRSAAVDDKPIELKLPEIAPARGHAGSACRCSFPDRGPHEFSLQLPDDALPGDNQRWAAMPVKDSLLIRLVDGEPSTEAFGSEIDYLAAPLSIGIGAAEAWRVEAVQEQDFLSPRLETPDVLVLGQRRVDHAGGGRAAQSDW